jgi:NADPH:quinone reductase-like Zn-dependent oxidoreductase
MMMFLPLLLLLLLLLFAGQVNKLATVLKPDGHLSHIMNNASDKADIQGLQQQHKQQQQDGGVEGPSASITLVQPNGAQLAEVFELIAARKVKLEVAKVGTHWGFV